ncbi:MAG: hypothetical protein ACJAW1_001654 [Glaciecola sp.]|jgi:hypothetical protein
MSYDTFYDEHSSHNRVMYSHPYIKYQVKMKKQTLLCIYSCYRFTTYSK